MGDKYKADDTTQDQGLSQTKKVTAILGGAFDPIHWDHLRMAAECVNFDLVDEVWLMPSPDLRWDKVTQFSGRDRLKAIQLAVKDLPGVFVSDFELERGEYRGSFVLLNALQEAYPQREFVLVMGADTLAGVKDWRDPMNWEQEGCNGFELLKNYRVLVFSRDGHELPSEEEYLQKGYQGILRLPPESAELIGGISSTEIRLRGLEKSMGLLPEVSRQFLLKS